MEGNNLFNKYHSKFIEEITDVNSKIVKGWFYLKPGDISKLSFREQYYFDGAYFRLNKIENYNPSNPVTKCEFLKLKDAEPFVPTTDTANGGVSALTPQEDVPRFSADINKSVNNNNIGNLRINVEGLNNYVSRTAQNVDIQGNGNYVFSDAKNITITGSNNRINGGVRNVVLINSNNLEVINSNVTYINNELRGDGSILTVTINTTADESVTTYIGDTSSGNITIIIPSGTTVGKIYNFKKISASNTLQVRGAGGETIDGAGTLSLTGLNDSSTLQFDGEKFIIL